MNVQLAGRLCEERERLGHTQAAFAALGHVSARAYAYYERGERIPDATFLSHLLAAGVDVLYLLTGERARGRLSTEMERLLELYQAASSTLRAAACSVLATGEVPAAGPQLRFEGDVGAAVAGDATFKGPVVGKKARKK